MIDHIISGDFRPTCATQVASNFSRGRSEREKLVHKNVSTISVHFFCKKRRRNVRYIRCFRTKILENAKEIFFILSLLYIICPL